MNAFISYNPATGQMIWQGDESSEEAIAATISTAHNAFNGWSLTPLEERISLLNRYADILKLKRDQIAELIANETGKVLREAKAEAGAMINKVTLSIDAYQERTGDQRVEMDGGIRRELTHRPIGVMAVFGPYNFPMHLPNGHMVPAMLAGNCVILKPSEQTPGCGELLVSLFQEAGFPEGVVSLLQGGRQVGVTLTHHKDISGILFTGSYATGKHIHQSLAGRPEVMLALEMGGNNPLIVHDAHDTEAAAKLVIDSAFATTGQRCTCARRLIVPIGEAGNALIDRVASLIDKLTVGSPLSDPEPYMGPLINNMQADQLLQAQAYLESHGARVIRRAKRTEEELPFVTPALLDSTMLSVEYDDEVFGPLLHVIRVRDMEEAVKVANDTAYGLSAGLISDKPEHWDYAYARLRAGIVNYNRPLTGAASAAPFGGPGRSGNYRPGAYYAADYCAYPVATLASDQVSELNLPGVIAN